MFFEPGILWSDTGTGVPPPFAHDDGVVFAPHIYRGGLTSGPVERSDFERARRDAATFGGAPVFVGEWGSGPERAEDPTDVYFRTHQQLQDEFHFSAALWTWRESCGDPHKAGDARAGGSRRCGASGRSTAGRTPLPGPAKRSSTNSAARSSAPRRAN